MGFNRNIITDEDVTNLRNARAANTALPKTLAASPPAEPGGTPTADEYMTKLVKYLPLEILGAYLFILGVINTNVTTSPARGRVLLVLLIASVLSACLYDRFVLQIQRVPQIVMTGVGFVIYVAATGGWFETTHWYHLWYSTIALALFSVAVAMLKLKPLPTE